MNIQGVILLAIISAFAAQNPQFYCGRRLARTLAALCSEDYLVKRSDVTSTSEDLYGYGMGYGSPWLAERQAQELHGGRGKRQVVSECCDKPCSIDETMTYCSH